MIYKKENLSIPEKTRRIPAIDRFRGLAMSLLIMFGAAIMFESTDFFVPLTTHDTSIAFLLLPGYALYDFGAPLFLFAAGLSFGLAFNAAEQSHGTAHAYYSIAKRALKIIGMGALLLFDLSDVIGIVGFVLLILCIVLVLVILAIGKKKVTLRHVLVKIEDLILTYTGVALLVVACIENVLYLCSVPVSNVHWGVLPSIGCAMLFAIPFVKMRPEWKVTCVMLFTAVYFSASLVIPQENFTYFEHGGVLGSLGYALSFLYADVVVSLSRIPAKRPYLPNAFALGIAVFATMAMTVADSSKGAVNPTYVLVSFVFSYALYLIVRLFDGITVKSFPVLTIIGQNCLLVYVLNFFLTYVYGICINAMVAYIPVGGEPFHIFMYFVGMSWYPLLMAAGLKSLNAKGIRLKV